MTKDEFIKKNTIRKLGLVEYIKRLEKQGLSERDVQAELIKRKIVKSPRMLDLEWKFYQQYKNEISWI